MLLNRLAHPSRLQTMVKMFGRSVSEISLIVNCMLDHIYDTFCVTKLASIDQPWVVNNLDAFAQAVSNKGSPLTRCICFLDGTVRPIARPTYNQQDLFSGHKRCHGLKYQSAVVPNGMIAELAGPFPSRRHDSWVLGQSNILVRLENLPGNVYGYGDPAYPLRQGLICPYKGDTSPQQQNFNSAMSTVRICVEWVFGKITNLWPYIDDKKNQTLYKQPVAKQYLVCAFLTNVHTCLYGSQTGKFFDLQPPTLEQYLD